MGAWGAIIIGFFGSAFAATTLSVQRHWTGAWLALPFLAFAAIALAAAWTLRRPGEGITPTPRVAKVIKWSSIGEGVGLFLAANLLINLHHSELLLQAMALVVGLHFLPIAYAATFVPFWLLGLALLAAAALGMAVGAPTGGEIAGFGATAALWIAAILAIHRDWQARNL